MTSKKRLSLQDVLNACVGSDNEERNLETDSDDSLNEDSSEEINLPQLIKNFMKNRLYSEIQCSYHQHRRRSPQ